MNVDGVAVTRHPVLPVSPVLVGTVDQNRKFNSLFIVTEGRREIIGDLATPASGQFALDFLVPRDDRDDVYEIVCLQQSEALPVVEAATNIDRFDVKLEVFESPRN